MNRWWGSSNDSQRQSAERSQRAARRTINNLDLHLSDEEEYLECDTSVHNRSIFSLDGAADELESDTVGSDSEGAAMPLSEAQLAAEKAKPV